jgi:hypothetical protein|tara:strand:+ start:1548 stop:1955 length:408 start_codon:yes stop_codon:yes gene_type:complete
MSIDSWSPDTASTVARYQIEQSLLMRFIDFAQQTDWSTLTTALTEHEIIQHQAIMKQTKDAWFNAAAGLDVKQIECLVRFFTVAEMQFSGWEVGADSPVIWLVKLLRHRNCAPNKELLLWIKNHSNNRFIPNGAL